MKDQSFDAMAKLRAVLENFVSERKIPIEEIEGGYVLDIPVEYDKFPDEKIDEDLDTLTYDNVMKTNLPPGVPYDMEKRKQYVYVTANRKGLQGEELYQIFTICAPENESFYRSALLTNMNLPFGAIALSEVEGENYFVLVDTYLAESVSEKELLISIMTLAKAGDKMEKLLIGLDIS